MILSRNNGEKLISFDLPDGESITLETGYSEQEGRGLIVTPSSDKVKIVMLAPHPIAPLTTVRRS